MMGEFAKNTQTYKSSAAYTAYTYAPARRAVVDSQDFQKQRDDGTLYSIARSCRPHCDKERLCRGCVAFLQLFVCMVFFVQGAATAAVLATPAVSSLAAFPVYTRQMCDAFFDLPNIFFCKTGRARQEAIRCILLGDCLGYLCALQACQALTSPKGMRHVVLSIEGGQLAIKHCDFLGSVGTLAEGAKGPASVGLVQPLVLGKQALQMGAGACNLFCTDCMCTWPSPLVASRHGAVHCVRAVGNSAAADSPAVRSLYGKWLDLNKSKLLFMLLYSLQGLEQHASGLCGALFDCFPSAGAAFVLFGCLR